MHCVYLTAHTLTLSYTVWLNNCISIACILVPDVPQAYRQPNNQDALLAVGRLWSGPK